MKRILYFIGFWIISVPFVFSQNQASSKLTLDNCIAIALENNNNLKSLTLQKHSRKINYKQSKSSLLPNLNANYNLGINNGRSIDPFTNAYNNRKLTFSNFGINLNTTIFNGFQMKNRIKQNKLNLQVSEMEVEEAKQNLILEVTLLYIQVLNQRDALTLSKARLETTKKQLDRLEALYKLGNGNPSDYSDMQGQYATNQAELINVQNTLKTTVINLSRLINKNITIDKHFETHLDLTPANKYPISPDQIYKDALENLATFKARKLRIDATNRGIKIAQSSYYPEISLFGQLNTNYSSAGESFTEIGTNVSETGNFVNINNQQYPVLTNATQYKANKISYTDQFTNNLSSAFGISIRIPLLNGFRAKNNISLEKIRLKENLNALENTKFIFKQAIQQAYNDMESSFERYLITQNQVTAFEESFRINEVKFNNNVSNILAYITSKNNMETAKLNLNKTKYEFVLRMKILEYYRGL